MLWLINPILRPQVVSFQAGGILIDDFLEEGDDLRRDVGGGQVGGGGEGDSVDFSDLVVEVGDGVAGGGA